MLGKGDMELNSHVQAREERSGVSGAVSLSGEEIWGEWF